MNNLSLIIGIVIIVLSIILIFVGGWEKFHLQRENNAWLALFIVGWISFVAGAGLILLGIVSNKKSKVPINKVSLVTPTGVVPITSIASQIGTSNPAAPSIGVPASSMGSLTSGPPAAANIPGPVNSSVPLGIVKTSIVPPVVGVSSMSNSVSGLISGPPSIYDLPPLPKIPTGPPKLGGGLIEYDVLQNTNYPASLKGGLFD
jgi:hypothetical protein